MSSNNSSIISEDDHIAKNVNMKPNQDIELKETQQKNDEKEDTDDNNTNISELDENRNQLQLGEKSELKEEEQEEEEEQKQEQMDTKQDFQQQKQEIQKKQQQQQLIANEQDLVQEDRQNSNNDDNDDIINHNNFKNSLSNNNSNFSDNMQQQQQKLEENSNEEKLQDIQQYHNQLSEAKVSYKQKDIRLLFVILLSICNGIGYYNNNWIALLKTDIFWEFDGNNQRQNMTESSYSAIFSISLIPGIFLGLFIVLIIQRLGIGATLILFSSVQLVGQMISIFGAEFNDYTSLVFGKLFLTSGVEYLFIPSIIILTQWSQDKKQLLTYLQIFFFTMNLCIVCAGWIYAPMYNSGTNLGSPVIVGFVLQFIAFSFSILVFIINNNANNYDKINNIKTITVNKVLAPFNPRDILKFNRYFWLNASIFTIFWSVQFTLMANLESFLELKYQMGSEKSGRIMTTPNVVGLLTPIFMYFIHARGQRPGFYFVGGIFACFGLLLLILVTPCNGECTGKLSVPMLFYGLSYCFFAATSWQMIEIVVPDRLSIFALGVTLSCKNLFASILTAIMGTILNEGQGTYTYQPMFYLILMAILVGLAVYLNFLDRKTGGRLKQIIPLKIDSFVSQQDDSTLTPMLA